MCLFDSLFSMLGDCWDFSIRHPGIVLVLIGVVGEGFEIFAKLLLKHWYEKHERFVDTWGAIFWIVVVLGLAWEIPEATKSEKEAAESNQKAGDAWTLAAQIGTTNAQLVADNLVLRSNVVALELKLIPRRITREQINKFIFLTEEIQKIPITINVYSVNSETETFATDLRQMLTEAGFGINSSAELWGLNHDPNKRLHHPLDKTNAIPNVVFRGYSTNGMVFAPTPIMTKTNGLNRPIVRSSDELAVYYGIDLCLQQIGITTEWSMTPEFDPRHSEIVIPDK